LGECVGSGYGVRYAIIQHICSRVIYFS
jgi:hypothetical protein